MSRTSRARCRDKAIQEHLVPLLRYALGSSVEIGGWTIGNQMDDYAVLIVQLLHPAMQVVVKMAGPKAPILCPFDRTAALLRLVSAKTTIPMPEVLAVDVSYRVFPWRYMIKAYIPGEEWMHVRGHLNADELKSAYTQIGETVAELHSIRFEGFGELAPDGSILKAAPLRQALEDRATSMIQTRRSQDLFRSVLDTHADLFQNISTPSLCHEDLHGHNILFRHEEGSWRLATILDFDKAWAGHSESDLARLELWRGMTSREFWQAYEASVSVNSRYAERRPVYQLLWCLEYARPTREHLADTRQVCAELGIVPVEEF